MTHVLTVSSQHVAVLSPPGCSDASSRPPTIRTYEAPKVRFSATVGEGPEAKVVLV